uniref:Zinc finger PHD-type domain-containing protein n=1 Tax=Anopheles atroparvus TaxID=41427 RepID=A0A182IY00_ANOAO
MDVHQGEEVCGVYGKAASDESVACAKCNSKFHLSCVNEDESVWMSDWDCAACLLRQAATGREENGPPTEPRGSGWAPPLQRSPANPAQPAAHERTPVQRELDNWARRILSAQGTPSREAAYPDAVQEVMSRMEQRFDALLERMLQSSASFVPAANAATPHARPSDAGFSTAPPRIVPAPFAPSPPAPSAPPPSAPSPPASSPLEPPPRVKEPLKSLDEFGKFMRTTKNALLHVNNPKPRMNERRHVSVHITPEPLQTPATTVERCVCGEGCDTLSACWDYWQLNVSERWHHVRRLGVCKACLKPHRGSCRETKPCSQNGCEARHHKSLHDDRAAPIRRLSPSSSKYANHHFAGSPGVLLRYVPVVIHGRTEDIHTLACLDEGSSVTLMEHALMDELGLSGSPKPLCLSWTGGQTMEEKNSVEMSSSISDTESNQPHKLTSVRTVTSLALPPQSVQMTELSARYEHLQQIPARSYKWTSPRLLIGIDNNSEPHHE